MWIKKFLIDNFKLQQTMNIVIVVALVYLISESKKVNRNIQEEPQAEAAANPQHQEEEKKSDTD